MGKIRVEVRPVNGIRITPKEALDVLPAWGIGDDVTFPRAGSGTANASIFVRAETGEYFLKRRNPRYSSPGQLLYDHSVLIALADAELPVAAVVLTLDGQRWHSADGQVYELYVSVPGDAYDAGNPRQVEAAGEVLARMHETLRSQQPAGEKPIGRLFGPGPSRDGLLWAMHRLRERQAHPPVAAPAEEGSEAETVADVREAHDTISYLLYTAESVAQDLPDALYWSLPATVVHGDYHPGNLLFSGDEVAGVFDFDWVSRQPRMTDITDGLMFFAGRRALPLDVADIRSLTQSFTFDWERMRWFLIGYERVAGVTDEELLLLPAFIRARWLYVRVDAMMRKVPEEERLEFLLNGVLRPLEWVEREEARLKGRAWLV